MSPILSPTMTTPAIHCFTFVEQFDRDAFYGKPDEFAQHREALLAFIREQADDTWVGLDFRQATYVGYSYAKQTVRVALKEQMAGLLGNRRIVLIGKRPKDDPSFFEGIDIALREADAVVLLTPSPDIPIEGWGVLGTLPSHLQETFAQLTGLNPISTAAFADILGQSIPNTNNRLKALHQLGLIKREKVLSSTGGYEWKNSVV